MTALKIIGIGIVCIIAFYALSKLQMKAWINVFEEHFKDKIIKIKKNDKEKTK